MKYLSAREFEDDFCNAIIEVARGNTIIITDSDTGEAIAEFTPADERLDISEADLLKELQSA